MVVREKEMASAAVGGAMLCREKPLEMPAEGWGKPSVGKVHALQIRGPGSLEPIVGQEKITGLVMGFQSQFWGNGEGQPT